MTKTKEKINISNELSSFFHWLDKTEMITDMFDGIDLCSDIAEIEMFEEINACFAKFGFIVRERIEEYNHKKKINLTEKNYADIAKQREKLRKEIFGDQLF